MKVRSKSTGEMLSLDSIFMVYVLHRKYRHHTQYYLSYIEFVEESADGEESSVSKNGFNQAIEQLKSMGIKSLELK